MSNTQIDDPDYTQDAVWNQITDLAQKEAQSLQNLLFGQYKLAYRVLIQQLSNESNARFDKASLESDLAHLVEKKSTLNAQFKTDLDTIHQLQQAHQEHPRSLLILDAAKENIIDLKNYADHHQPNVLTLAQPIQQLSVHTQEAVQHPPAPDSAKAGS